MVPVQSHTWVWSLRMNPNPENSQELASTVLACFSSNLGSRDHAEKKKLRKTCPPTQFLPCCCFGATSLCFLLSSGLFFHLCLFSRASFCILIFIFYKKRNFFSISVRSSSPLHPSAPSPPPASQHFSLWKGQYCLRSAEIVGPRSPQWTAILFACFVWVC